MEMRGGCQAALGAPPAKRGCRDSPGLRLTPEPVPEGRQSCHPPRDPSVRDLSIPAAKGSVQVQPHGDAERQMLLFLRTVKTIHCETAAVHDIPGFIFLFSFALFSCLYIGHVNTHGLSWFRRLPRIFHSC